ncbi:MAG: aspartate/glutamate racemase family protein, partial [Burkholderiales bacterium]
AGLIIAAFGDPGLDAAKTRWALPMTGIAEAGMAEAAAGGRRFSVVTTTPRLVDSIGARARAYGHGERFLGVRLTPGDPALLMADPERLVGALEEACRAAIEIDGAEAIVIGGGPLAVAARALQGRFRLHGEAAAVPIVEPIPAAVRLALARAACMGFA